MFGHVLQVPLRGHPAFDYKLQAAGHIYNLWTAKGAEPCALASRYASISHLPNLCMAPRLFDEPFAYTHPLSSLSNCAGILTAQ